MGTQNMKEQSGQPMAQLIPTQEGFLVVFSNKGLKQIKAGQVLGMSFSNGQEKRSLKMMNVEKWNVIKNDALAMAKHLNEEEKKKQLELQPTPPPEGEPVRKDV